MELATVLRALELGGLAGIRPSWVLLGVAVSGALGWVHLPEGLSFVGTWPGAGVLLVVATVEALAERDTDWTGVFTAVQLGLAVAGALLGTSALSSLEGRVPPWAVQAGAVLLALLTVGLRRTVKTWLVETVASLRSPTRWLARLEEGGWLLAVVLLWLAPALLLLLLVSFALGGFAAVAFLRTLDRRRRIPCPGCGVAVRVEASRCPSCRGALAPVRNVELPAPLAVRLRAAWRLRGAGTVGEPSGPGGDASGGPRGPGRAVRSEP